VLFTLLNESKKGRNPKNKVEAFFRGHIDEKAAAIGSIGGGSDWLGLGTIAQSLSKGTSLCGSKPICISTKSDDNCAKKQRAYEACVQQNVALAQNQFVQKTNMDLSRQKRTLIFTITGMILLSIVVVTFLVIRSKN